MARLEAIQKIREGLTPRVEIVSFKDEGNEIRGEAQLEIGGFICPVAFRGQFRADREGKLLEVQGLFGDNQLHTIYGAAQIAKQAIIDDLMASWKKFAKESWNLDKTKNMPAWVREALGIPKVKTNGEEARHG